MCYQSLHVYREFKETNTSTDIGIKPAAGIFPKKLALEEIKPDPSRKYFHKNIQNGVGKYRKSNLVKTFTSITVDQLAVHEHFSRSLFVLCIIGYYEN